MLAVIEMGGKQFRVAPEQVLYVDPTGQKVGSEMNIDQVLLVQKGTDVKVGQPYVKSAKVKAKVLADVKGDKIHGFTYKRRKNIHRSWGHRQPYQKLQIVSISA